MSGGPHHFLPGLTNTQQSTMRSQFTAGPMQNQMGQMPSQLTSQMPVQMSNQLTPQMNNQMISQITNTLNTQMNPGMAGNNQILGQLNQQYNMSPSQMPQHQGTPMQMQQTTMSKFLLSLLHFSEVCLIFSFKNYI